MGTSLRVGRILGIPVSIHFSWLIILFLFTFVFQGHFDRNYGSWSAEEIWLAALATSLLLFLSVLAHELSHSLVAMKQGIPVKGITLFVFGGMAQIGKEAERPSAEFMMAVVGPLSSIALGFLFIGLAFGLDGVSTHLSAIAGILGSANIVLGVFNMLPGFPMDGGRVLRAAVWRVTRNYWRATRLATMVGQTIAFALIGAGIALIILDRGSFVQGVLWVAVGIFLQTIASASLRQVRLREVLHTYKARDLIATDYPAAPVDVDLRKLVEEYMAPRSGIVILTGPAGAKGIVTRRAIERVPREEWHLHTASSLMVPLEAAVTVGPEEDAYDVLELMQEKGVEGVLVVHEGHLLGAIPSSIMRRFAKAHG